MKGLIPQRIEELTNVVSYRTLKFNEETEQMDDLKRWSEKDWNGELRPDTTGPVSRSLGEAVRGLISGLLP